MRLCCARCGAGLVPAWSGLRCPRLNACGRGGYVETLQVVHPLARQDGSPTGAQA